MNIPWLVAAPPAVVITMFPVFAPVGTIAVTCGFEFLVTVVAFTPPNAMRMLVVENDVKK